MTGQRLSAGRLHALKPARYADPLELVRLDAALLTKKGEHGVRLYLVGQLGRSESESAVEAHFGLVQALLHQRLSDGVKVDVLQLVRLDDELKHLLSIDLRQLAADRNARLLELVVDGHRLWRRIDVAGNAEALVLCVPQRAQVQLGAHTATL